MASQVQPSRSSVHRELHSTLGSYSSRQSSASDAYACFYWAVPTYARLDEDTHDSRYLEVARILVFNTRSMVALPDLDLIVTGEKEDQALTSKGFAVGDEYLQFHPAVSDGTSMATSKPPVLSGPA
jgi:hypothetical protein